jgi:dihydroflavonol-4-reductase
MLRDVAPLLGDPKPISHEKATRMLGWAPRSNEAAVLASAQSLVRLGLAGPGRSGSTLNLSEGSS